MVKRPWEHARSGYELAVLLVMAQYHCHYCVMN